jgi:hypothetical protein
MSEVPPVSHIATMDLITSLSPFQMLASIPLLVMLVPFALDLYKNLMANPIFMAAVNTTLVVLKNTELVWRPALNFAIAIIKPIVKALAVIFPQVKAIVIVLVNQTVAAVQYARSMGMSLMTALTSIVERMGEVGDALIVVARGMGQVGYYGLRVAGTIVGSFESVFAFGKRALFEGHLLTANDLYNVMMPFFTVVAVLATVYWVRKGPSPQKCVETFQPRRSSRIARKRAMLCASDMSDALLPSKKSSPTTTNL